MDIAKNKFFYQVTESCVIKKQDSIASEYALTIFVNNEEVATIVCTPENLEEMVVGFLISEGIVREVREIDSCTIQNQRGMAYVQVTQLRLPIAFRSKRYIASCCGLSRQGFYFVNDTLTVKNMKDTTVRVSFQQMQILMKNMQEKSKLFQETGGVHNAALCSSNEIYLMRADVGRHNALDKIYGHCLKNNISLKEKLILFSGRISSEIVLKIAKMGCELIVSKSAPTALALEIADQQGITTVGFLRGERCNVYTQPQRILELQNFEKGE